MPTISDSFKQAILEAAGLQNLTGDAADDAVQIILNDHWALDRGWRAASEAFIPDALRRASFTELEALRKRLQPKKPAAQEVTWGYSSGNDTRSGRSFITATRGAETSHWEGDASKIHLVEIFGQHVPGDIQYMYRLQAGIALPDPDWVREQKEQKEYANQAQAKRAHGGEEALVREQEALSGVRIGK